MTEDAAILESEATSTSSELEPKNTHLSSSDELKSSLNPLTKDLHSICKYNEGEINLGFNTPEESTENENPIQFSQSVEVHKDKEVGSIKSYLGSFFKA